MNETILIGLSSVIVLGILAQWLAWRFHLPAILLLMIFGFVAGPISGILDPYRTFGEILFPLVSLSVSIVLFEGALSLRFAEIKQSRTVVLSMTTIGIILTWVCGTLAAQYLIGLEFRLAVLFGAILVVSGPTVIIPIIRQIRPIGRIGSIAKWEGIVNDPIGAILAVIVFEVIITGNGSGGTGMIFWGAFKALVSGSLIGLVGAGILILLLWRYLIPDFLQSAVALMIVIICYALSNAIQHESGLMAVTVMGVAVANQKVVSIRHILEFKENLRVLIISSLFIILSSTLTVEQLPISNFRVWLFVLVMIIAVRPVMVFLSTFGSKLATKERLFLSFLAPRGIVAAAVSSVFALRMTQLNIPGGDSLAALTFLVVICTVAFYGLFSPYIARILGVANSNPQGLLIVGAQRWAQQIASALQGLGFKVVLIDSNWEHVTQARVSGLEAIYGNILSEELGSEIQFEQLGRIMALTSNDEVNSLALLHFSELFGRKEVYQPVPVSTGTSSKVVELPKHLRGRYLFDKKATHDYLENLLTDDTVIRKTPITEEFDFDDYKRQNPDILPMFISTKSGNLVVCTVDYAPTPRPGDTMISAEVKGTIVE